MLPSSNKVLLLLLLFVIINCQEEFEDTKGVIRICKSKKDRQHNGQKKKDTQRSTKHTHKTKDRATRTPLKTTIFQVFCDIWKFVNFDASYIYLDKKYIQFFSEQNVSN